MQAKEIKVYKDDECGCHVMETTFGHKVLFDETDLSTIESMRWYSQTLKRGTPNIFAMIDRGRSRIPKRVILGRVLLDITDKPDKKVRFLNGEHLDFRRGNIVAMSDYEWAHRNDDKKELPSFAVTGALEAA